MDNGTILTSVIGASAATIGVVVAKDTKVSEFRQQWIDALREDVAKLCSTSVSLFHGNVRWSIRDRLPDTRQVDLEGLTEQANNLGYRVTMRLDKGKPHSLELIAALDDLVHLATHAQEPFEVVNRGVEAVMNKTDVVLEDAWQTVKRGEPRFRWTFRFAFATLLLTLVVVLLRWLAQHFALLHRFSVLQ